MPTLDRLKILHIAAWYPSEASPTDATFIREHIRCAAIYNDATVWAFYICRKPGGRSWERQDSVEHGIPTVRTWKPFGWASKLRYLIQLRAWANFGGKLIEERGPFDLIHAHPYPAGVVAALLGRRFKLPVVVTEHWTGFQRGLLTPSEKLKAHFAFAHARRVMPVSPFLQAQIERCGLHPRFEIVPNAIETDLFHPADCPAPLPWRLLTVANLIPHKGIPILLEAIRRLQEQGTDLRLTILGDGPDRAEYQQLCDRLGVSGIVEFKGSVPKPEVARLMQASHVLVHPSLIETFSCVIAEALCCGLPVVASDIPPLPDLVNPSNGQLFKPGDATALERVLLQMFADYTRYDRAAIASATSARYNYAAVGARFDRIYREVIK